MESETEAETVSHAPQLNIDSAEVQQQIYRAVLEALSYPGKRQSLDALVSITERPAWGILLPTLVDENASLADLDSLLDADDWTRLRCAQSPTDAADFLLATGSLKPDADLRPKQGSLYHPHDSATILLVCQSIVAGDLECRVTGAGVETENRFSVAGLSTGWLKAREGWVSHFPMGVDMLLVDQQSILGIPRTSKLEYETSASSNYEIRGS